MPLILAIEADRRQTSKIAALAKGQLHAELVTGDTTEHAIAALDGRVPDLILTSLLLSPKDETKLTEWLRELDSEGRHVQTLVIPVLGVPAGSQEDGWLSKRRRRNKDATPEGCDPAVFAAQVSEYLERVSEDRRAAAAQRSRNPKRQVRSAPAAPARVEEFAYSKGAIRAWEDEPQPVEPVQADPDFDKPDFDASPQREYEPEPQPAYEPEAEPTYEREPQQVHETAPPVYEPEPDPEPSPETPPGDILGLRSWDPVPVDPEPDGNDSFESPEPVAAGDFTMDREEVDLRANFDEPWKEIAVVRDEQDEEEEEEQQDEEVELKAESIDLDTFVSELRALGGQGQNRPRTQAPPPRPAAAAQTRPAPPPPVAPVNRSHPPAAAVAPPRQPAPVAPARPANASRLSPPTRPTPPPLSRPAVPADVDSSVEEFMAALDAMHRIERVKPTSDDPENEPVFSSPPLRSRPKRRKHMKAPVNVVAPVAAVKAANHNVPVPKPQAETPPAQTRPAHKRPAQDEFGMFDPQQCGFAALMAKLDELSEEERKEERKKNKK
jgi:hypothetical protein